MNNLHTLTFFIAVLITASGSPFCASNVCFYWTLYDDALELRCLITDLKHRVFIFDPNRKVQADCLPGSPPDCSAYFNNGTTYYDGATNEIVFTLRGDIGQNIEGKWVCEHGRYRDAAYADVKYVIDLASTEQKMPIITEAVQTVVTTSRSVMTSSYIQTSTITEEETSKHTTSSTTGKIHGNKKDTTYHGNQHWRYIGPMIGIGIFCVVLFVCNLSVNCKHANFTPVTLNTEINTNHRTHSQQPRLQTSIENNVGQEIHDYEIIDDIELIENSVSQMFIQQNTLFENNDVSLTFGSTSTPSGHSYLEVIDNPQIEVSEYLEPSNYKYPEYLMITNEQVGTLSVSQSASHEDISNLKLDMIDVLADNSRFGSDNKRLSKSSLDGEDNIQLHDQNEKISLSSSPECSDNDHLSSTQSHTNMFNEVL